MRTLREILTRLRETYSGNIGYEVRSEDVFFVFFSLPLPESRSLALSRAAKNALCPQQEKTRTQSNPKKTNQPHHFL